jgi:hypothetical protein
MARRARWLKSWGAEKSQRGAPEKSGCRGVSGDCESGCGRPRQSVLVVELETCFFNIFICFVKPQLKFPVEFRGKLTYIAKAKKIFKKDIRTTHG